MFAKFVARKNPSEAVFSKLDRKIMQTRFSKVLGKTKSNTKLVKQVRIYDTTLRDGSQGIDVNFSIEDKLKVARKLDEFGVHYIEGGWPNPTNPPEIRLFKLLRDLKMKSKIVAFGMTRKPNVKAEQDENLKALLDTEADCITIVGKSWDLHVDKVIETTPQKNLEMIFDSVSYLTEHGYHVIFDAEHFYDGFKSNRRYAVKTALAAAEAGAKEIVLCDTRGGSMPNEIYEVTRVMKRAVRKPLGVHAHNDRGLATVNSIYAVMAGAEQVQCTVNGIGERCGNANLIEVVGNLEFSMGIHTGLELSKLTQLSDYVYEISNLTGDNYDPFVGKYAFTHKAGVHGHAVIKFPEAYEHVDPGLLGNRRDIALSSQSGLANILLKAKEFGFNLDKNSPKAVEIMRRIKDMEAAGYHLENANATLNLIYARAFGVNLNYFSLVNWKASVMGKDGGSASESTVEVAVGERRTVTSAEGNGPVNAFDLAFRRALETWYPELSRVKLVGYRVREIGVERGTASMVRVFIEFEGNGMRWSTVGVSTNILKASEEALLDGYIYYLHKIGKESLP